MIPESSPHRHTHSSPSTAALLPAPVGWTRLMKSCMFPSGNGEQPRLEGELRRACPWATWAYRTTDESYWGPRNSCVAQEVREGMLAHHSDIVKVTLGAQEPLLPSLRDWRWHPCPQHLQNFLLRSGTQEPPLLETEVHRGHLIPPWASRMFSVPTGAQERLVPTLKAWRMWFARPSNCRKFSVHLATGKLVRPVPSALAGQMMTLDSVDANGGAWTSRCPEREGPTAGEVWAVLGASCLTSERWLWMCILVFFAWRSWKKFWRWMVVTVAPQCKCTWGPWTVWP